MVNGAFFVPSGEGLEDIYDKASSTDPKSAALVDKLTQNAGVLGEPRFARSRSLLSHIFPFPCSSFARAPRRESFCASLAFRPLPVRNISRTGGPLSPTVVCGPAYEGCLFVRLLGSRGAFSSLPPSPTTAIIGAQFTRHRSFRPTVHLLLGAKGPSFRETCVGYASTR